MGGTTETKQKEVNNQASSAMGKLRRALWPVNQ